IRLVASGPAGGVVGAAALGHVLGFPNVITTDVGGTSFDVGLVVDGEPLVNARPVFGKYHTVLPVTDVASIGAGGGSIAWIERAIAEKIAEPLGLSVADAAMGIVEILDARMADLVRRETIGRGYDPGDFALFAFGGAGPLHVCAYGRDVGVRAIVVPANASVF